MKLRNSIMTAACLGAIYASGATESPRTAARIVGETDEARCEAAAPARAASYKTKLVGFMYYAESWNHIETGNTPLGIYTIDAVPGAQPEQFARIGMANSYCNGGAVLAGDTFWYIWRQSDETAGIDLSQLYTYNVVTGEFANRGMVDSALASNSDHAWDSTEDKIYGQYTVDGGRKLCVVDYEAQTLTPVGDCRQYYGLAFDAAGQLWGIDDSGDLYKVDKTNGAATKVGSTGITPAYAQSMTFDLKTGVLYWASYQDAGAASSNLYTVDTATGLATLVTAFTDEEEFFGLGVMPPMAKDNAPGLATSLALVNEAPALTGTFSFTLPLDTYMGSALEGEIGYKVYANGNDLFSGSGQPGESVSKEVTLPNGDVTVSVVCSNAEGDGPAAEYVCWVGEDYPVAPESVSLQIEEATGKVSLSWAPVTAGTHNGYIDPSKVTYTVTRFPGEVEVAANIAGTSFEETLEEPELPVDYHYTVKALNGWRESEVTESNHIPFGKGFKVPYYNNFDDASSLDLFYKIDGNGDGSTWKWSRFRTQTAYIFTGSDAEGQQDDWLITPGIDMKAGTTYRVSYTIPTSMNNGKFVDFMETAFGRGVNPADYVVAEQTFASTGLEVENHSFEITPETDGYYHIGFHAVSDCKIGLSLAIDDLSIDAMASQEAPAAVTDLTVKSSQGTPPITLRFKAPTKCVNGSELVAIEKIEVYRNTNDLVKTIDNPQPGKSISVTDNKGSKGMTEYTVVAYNAHGIGERATVSIYLGLDLPGAPRDITLTDMGKGKLKLTWSKPAVGANGGYCDPDNLTYTVYAINASGYAVPMKENIPGYETVIDEDNYYQREQTPVFYGLSASNSIGEGGAYASTEVMIGLDYSYPFTESWGGGQAAHSGWYRMSNGEQGWLPESGEASDNDGGCMEFHAAADGDLSYLCLGKVDMTTCYQPKLLFDYYVEPGADLQLLAEINLAYTGQYLTLEPISFADDNGEAGWREAVVDLADVANSYSYLAFRFLGRGTRAVPLRIDNVRVMDSDKTPNLGAGIDGPVVDSDVVETFYDLNGLRVNRPQPGAIYVVRRSDGTVGKVIF